MFGFFKKKNNEAAPEVKQAPEEVTNETIEETELIVEDSQESAKSQIAEEAIEDMSEDIPQDVSEESAAEEPVPEKTTIDESVEEQKTGFFAKHFLTGNGTRTSKYKGNLESSTAEGEFKNDKLNGKAYLNTLKRLTKTFTKS